MSASERLDIAIVGGGAAGLMAAIFAGRTARAAGAALRIAVLDGAARPGAKILVAGGGRCNVTHDAVSAGDFAGANPRLINRVLRGFDVPATIRFFREIGVALKREDTGKLFPVSDDARTVLDALLAAVRAAGVGIRCGCRVADVARGPDGFSLRTSAGDVAAARVILATGGKSLPRTGSDGAGLDIATRLGHSVTATFPSLVPLMLPRRHWLTALSGISIDSRLKVTSAAGRLIARRDGAMLLTHFGLSGPAVLDISRHWIAARRHDPAAKLVANLCGGATFEDVDHRLRAAFERQPRCSVAAALGDWLPDRFAAALCEHGGGVVPGTAGGQLPRELRRALTHALTALPLPAERDRGYLFAEVTAGGVPLEELDLAGMASKRAAGLHLCGEMLDVDGRIGGYNFQWAWCSGRLAGTAAAGAVLEAATRSA